MDKLAAIAGEYASQVSACTTSVSSVHQLGLRFLGDALLPTAISAAQSMADIENAIPYIDQQINLLQQHKRDLTERHNLNRSVSRLPAEILSEIFRYLTPPFASDEITKGWLNFSHVCRRWRDTAIHNPSLWMHPYFEHPKLAKEMILRTENHPLHINIHQLSSLSSSLVEALKLAFEKPENIRALNAQIHHYLDLDTLLTNFPGGEAPSLERCAITRRGTEFSSSLKREDYSHLRISAPRLRSIVLRDVIFPLRIQPLHSLVTLDIVNAPSVASRIRECCLTIPTLLGFIQTAPCLETLILRNALIAEASLLEVESTSSAITTVAPRLRSWIIQDSIHTVLQLLRHLETPVLSNITIKPNGLRGTLDLAQSQALLQELDRIISGSSCPLLHRLQIQRHFDELTIEFSSQNPSTNTPNLLVKMWVCLRSASEHAPLLRFAQNSMTCLSTLNEVGTSANFDMDWDDMWATLGSFPLLTHISASNLANANALIHTLSQPRGDTSHFETLARQNMFMRVSSITFHNLEPVDEPWFQDGFLVDCKAALVYRRAIGMPLEKLSFIHWKIPLLWVEDLRATLLGVRVEYGAVPSPGLNTHPSNDPQHTHDSELVHSLWMLP